MTAKKYMAWLLGGVAVVAASTFFYLKYQERKNLVYAEAIIDNGVAFSEEAVFDSPPLPADVEDYDNLESLQDWLGEVGIEGNLLDDFENSEYDNFDDFFYGN